jgi:hypothetical protein
MRDLTTRFLLCILFFAVARSALAAAPSIDQTIRVGIIGCDTSHAPAFAKLINQASPTAEIAAMKVVAAYPGGSPDIAQSRDRIDGFTTELRSGGVKIVNSIEELLPMVDAVLLLSVDGRKHLEQLRPVLAARKPVYIDKPLAGSLADAVEIFRLAGEAQVPCFSSSSMRFVPSVFEIRQGTKIPQVLGCDVYAPCKLEPHHPDLFWYGVHGVEMLFTIMGTGCESVSRTHTRDTDIVTGVWKDGRIGTYRGTRSGQPNYGFVVHGSSAINHCNVDLDYEPLLRQIAGFFKNGKPPVRAEETLEIFAFLESGDESKRRGGVPVRLAEVLEGVKNKSNHH